MNESFKIISSEYITSSASGKNIEIEEFRQIVFTGKSNVGKSSLINSLLNRKNLAKTGNTPGKTRLINFFLVNSSFYFVDLPGYGYAAVSKTEKQKWKNMIEVFFRNTKSVKLAFSILDIRHPPTENDFSLIRMFESLKIPQIIILNKKDKLSNNELFVQMKLFKKIFSEFETIFDFVPYSSVNHFNREKVLDYLDKAVNEEIT
ncbi:MAG: ribosome biogenesis GTP-binding protein YihA/YsxC [Candidatus Delongbacteria bacterium]|nr:ribosome biogenesis GTP-binding protein YihA/YsxC [Candidatus Delongbacteria bacterium]MCG2759987.1 ribosome biogenesis GTP-binding protein YihA/YsxC [Candidatus Delongbacteria bacterium]